MVEITLKNYPLKTKNAGGKTFVFDIIRKKFVRLVPEELVRQQLVHYLIKEKLYPRGRIATEMEITYNMLRKRCDLVVFNASGMPCLVAELKAPGIRITETVFEQIAQYNLALRVKCLIISNGINHFCLSLDKQPPGYRFLKEIPDYAELTAS